MEEFNVGVVGAGHVGLVTSASLADIGHWITLVDVDVERRLDDGRMSPNFITYSGLQ